MKWMKKSRGGLVLLCLMVLLLAGCGAPAGAESSGEAETLPVEGSSVPDGEQLPEADADGAEAPPAAEPPAGAAEGKSPAAQEPPARQDTPAAETPKPVEPQKAEPEGERYTCTLSISCATILDHLEQCDAAKAELVPADGWILQPVEVEFYEGESVFNVLQRTCKQQKIHMEHSNTPLYNSAYIEGIANLYEFDVGELSGWMYSVNGWFPNYGCSRYGLQDGDTVCWVYTCDLGADVGGAGVDQRDE